MTTVHNSDDLMITAKINEMLKGEAVVMSDAWVNRAVEINKTGIDIRTAHHIDRLGVRDQWVCWMSGRDSTKPPDLHINTETLKSYARPGRCRYSRSLEPVPDNYHVITH